MSSLRTLAFIHDPSMITMQRLILLFLPALTAGAVSAQTMFIPDTYLRTWLNNAKPGVVDGSGNCDTVSWNAVPPNSVTFGFSSVPNGSTVDLTGIQYLKMNTLFISDGSQSGINVTWPGHPLNNNNLHLINVDVQLFTGPLLPLPSGLANFECDACGITTVPAFNGPVLDISNVDLGGQVLTISNTVTWLHLGNCNLTQIPSCPNVSTLTVSDNPLADWTNLPTGLNSLYAANVGLTYLPTLPVNLSVLYYHNNGLTSLPALPQSLTMLAANDNALTSIAALPPALGTLAVGNNPLSALPSMPNSLWNLVADSCAFTTLGPLGSGLTSIMLNGNPLTELPPLPPGLATLRLKNCAALECLPLLPQTLVTLQLYNSGVSCLPNIPPSLDLTGGQDNLGIAPTFCDLTNTSCELVIPYATGTIFNDADTDGAFDVGETPRSYGIVAAQPGDYLAGSDINGRYVLPLDIGTFTVDGIPSLYEPITTAPYVMTFAGPGEVDSLNHVGYEHVPGIYDLVTDISGSVVRPGFHTNAWVTVQNLGTEPTDALVELTFDADLEYLASTYVPNTVNANVIEWNSGTLYPGQSWTTGVSFHTPASVPLGTAVDHTALSTPDQADLTPVDNLAFHTDTVVGSYDPNDKRVEPSTLTPQEVQDGKRVEYTVRFQNTGTYPAERVLITDTLSEDLQALTMQPISSSHANTWFIRNGVLHVLFENINLPDSVSDEPNSHGFVKFSFKPVSSLLLGESVGNIANIYFDFNEPVITNEAVVSVETSTTMTQAAESQGWSIWPNPASDMLLVKGVEPNTLISVLDPVGRTVLTDAGANDLRIFDIRDLRAGAYLVRLVNGGSSQTRTFVKP